ncbi:hypothetical protein PR048_030975 [Dryococelus australis]|uniref:Uncharacterized protein n=1 Tax=Dryococelus australis TaxID=614101 RepID=A0ABQ9G828_9NEOP|nr:hypothetical protein PR048_030975 [Dryococelus australis]
MERRRKREIPEKTRRPKPSPGTIPTCENPGTGLHNDDVSAARLDVTTMMRQKNSLGFLTQACRDVSGADIVTVICKDKDPNMKTSKRPCQYENKQFSCKRVTMFDMVKSRSQLYQTPNKAVHQQHLCHFTSVGEPKRKLPCTAMAHYRFDPDREPAMPILKSGKVIPDAMPEIYTVHNISKQKEHYVQSLLCKQFGEDLPDKEDLHGYKGILDLRGERTEKHNVPDDERLCSCVGEDKPHRLYKARTSEMQVQEQQHGMSCVVTLAGYVPSECGRV